MSKVSQGLRELRLANGVIDLFVSGPNPKANAEWLREQVRDLIREAYKRGILDASECAADLVDEFEVFHNEKKVGSDFDRSSPAGASASC